jgi:TolA-binding protein
MESDGPNMQADLLAQLEQQLAAANARVQQLERYIDGNDLRSDYQTAGHMRQALEHANARVQQLEQMAKVGEMFMSLFEKAADRPVLPSEALVVETALDWIGRAKRAESTLAACREAGWREAKHTDTFAHGDMFLAAVRMHPLGQQPHWEIALLRVDDGDNRRKFRLMAGDEWRWYWDDVRFWMPVTMPAAEAARGDTARSEARLENP